MPSPNQLTLNPDVVPRSEIEVVRAHTLGEALDHMNAGQGAGKPFMPLAGGTDLMVWITQRAVVPPRVLDLWSVRSLRGITESEDDIQIGALTTYTDMIQSPIIAAHCSALADSAKLCGAAQIQNRGTLGGNIAGGSPAGDALPMLLAYNAELTLASVRGTRMVPFTAFYTGYRQNVMEPDELIVRINIPKLAPGSFQAFRKVGTRMAQSISKVMLGFCGRIESGRVAELTIALGSVAPTPIRLLRTEQLLIGNAIDDKLLEAARGRARKEISSIDDVRSTAEYRNTVAGNLVVRYLRKLAATQSA